MKQQEEKVDLDQLVNKIENLWKNYDIVSTIAEYNKGYIIGVKSNIYYIFDIKSNDIHVIKRYNNYNDCLSFIYPCKGDDEVLFDQYL